MLVHTMLFRDISTQEEEREGERDERREGGRGGVGTLSGEFFCIPLRTAPPS